MQLDELKRAKNSAFNWSDEELLGDMDDVSDIVYKDKYAKRKSKKGGPKGGSSAYSQIKQSVKRGYSQAKESISGGNAPNSALTKTTRSQPLMASGNDPLGGQKTQLIKPSWDASESMAETAATAVTQRLKGSATTSGIITGQGEEALGGKLIIEENIK